MGRATAFVPFVLFVVPINAEEQTGKNHEGDEDHGMHRRGTHGNPSWRKGLCGAPGRDDSGDREAPGRSRAGRDAGRTQCGLFRWLTPFVPFALFVVRINAKEPTGKDHEGL